jgi:tetratricopeptide (TPR) repeat protein
VCFTRILACAWLAAAGPACRPSPTASDPPPESAAASERRLREGLRLLRAGRYEPAVSHFLALAADHPESGAAFANLGLAYWKQDRPEDALEALARAADLAPEDPRPLEFAAHILGTRGDWDAARRFLDRAHAQSSGSARILTRMAAVEFAAGDTAAARSFLARALEREPRYAPALYDMGLLLAHHLHAPDEAVAAFEHYLRLAKDDPHRSQAQEELRGLELVLEQAEVEAAVRAMTDDDLPWPPPAPPATAAVPEPEPGADTAPTAEGLAGYGWLQRTSPADPLVRQAREAIENRSYDAALVMLKQAVETDTNCADAVWLSAVLYDEHLGHPEKAKERYAEFKQRFGWHPNARLASMRLLRSRDPQKAQSAFDRGMARYRSGDLVGAVIHFKRALEHDDSFAPAAYNLGLCYKRQGESQAARSAFEQALAADRGMADAAYMLALLDREAGRMDEAREELDQLLGMHPDHARGHLLLGILAREADDRGTARTHLSRFVELAPADPAADSARAWLQDASTP